MRITLTIDDDVLDAAKATAKRQRSRTGKVLSELARRALRDPKRPVTRNGIRLLQREDGASVVTIETINALRDESP